MDMRSYAVKVVKPDQVRDGPITTRILSVFEDERYGRPVLELEIGSRFMLNDTNCNTLINAWGTESRDGGSGIRDPGSLIPSRAPSVSSGATP